MLRLVRLLLDILFLTVDVARTLAWDVQKQVSRLLRMPLDDHDPLHRDTDYLKDDVIGCPRASKYGSLAVFRLLCPFAQRAETGQISCTFQAEDPQQVYWPPRRRRAALGLGLGVFWVAAASGALVLARGHSVKRQQRAPERRDRPLTAKRAEPRSEARRSAPPQERRPQQPDVREEAAALARSGAGVAGPSPGSAPAESLDHVAIDDAKPRAKAQKFVESGDGYFKEERYMEALIEYKNATRQDPSHAAAWLGLGRSHLRLERNPREALHALDKAVQLDPALAEAHRELATVALAQRDATRAVLHARKLKELRSTDAGSAAILSSCLYAAGDEDTAVAEMAAAVELPTATGDTFAAAGELHLRRNAPEEAETACRRAVELDPGHTMARVCLACSLRRQGKLREARQELDVALKDHAENASVVIEQVELLVAEGEAKAAIATLTELTRRSPKLYDSRARLAELLIASRRAADGVAVAQRVLKEQPRHVASHLVLSRTFLAKQLHNMALDHCEKALREERTDLAARTLKARIHLSRQQYEEAVRELLKVLSEAPSHVTAKMLLGQSYKALRQFDKATRCFGQVAEALPQSPHPHINLGDLALMRGLPEAAILCYESALKRAPNNPTAANNVASLLLDRAASAPAKDAAEARADIARAYELAGRVRRRFPGHAMAADTYGWACYMKGDHAQATEALAFAARRLPRNASVRHHHGMALYKTGVLDRARVELRAALDLSDTFAAAEQAKATLAEISRRLPATTPAPAP